MRTLHDSSKLNTLYVILSFLIVLCAYFAVSTYWLIVGLTCLSKIILGIYAPTQELLKAPWWMAIFYSSEVGGIIGVIFRWLASICALYAALLFGRRKEVTLQHIKGIVGIALLFEGIYFLSLIPTVVLGFIYPFLYEQLYYFDATPKLIVFLIDGLACLFMVTIIPPHLFKLRSAVLKGESNQEIVKWSSLTSVSYLFAAFWFNYSMVWLATLVPWPNRGQPGLSFLMEPLNFISFTATTIGLLLIALFVLVLAFPAIRKSPEKMNLKRLGIAMTAFGGYLLLMIILYILSGGYEVHPTAWHEIIGPAHNPDLWCISFLFAGLLVLVGLKNQRRSY